MTLSEQLKREVGQHFVLGFHGSDVDADVTSLISDYHVGNIILMKRNLRNFEQTHKLIRDLQQLAKDSGHAKPLLIGIDQENGLVSGFSVASGAVGTQFPGAMALAATGSTELAEKVTAASAAEMRHAGINWAYSPVADVNSDSRNPVIGARSYGDDPQKVAIFSNAVCDGLSLAGIAPSAKHFPGHGDTYVDSHLGLPRILKSKEQLVATELVPFQLLVENRIATVMTGHMALPNIIGDDTPCSLSRLITTDLLRNEMKYDGVIVTDCLEMDAIKETYGIAKGSLLAFQAGADIVMICHTLDKQQAAIELVSDAVEKGELSVEALQASGHRIQAFKSKFAGSWADVLDRPLDTSKLSQLKLANAELSLCAYSLSTSLITDPSSILPLKAAGNIVVLTPENEGLNKAVDDAEGVLRNRDGKSRNTAGASDDALARSIAKRLPASRHAVYTKDLVISGELDEILRSSESIVFATRNADRSSWQLDYLQKVVEKAPAASVVIVATCNPYDLLNSSMNIDFKYAYIATFEFTPPALEAAAAVIFGEKKATGKAPILGGKVYR